MTTAGILRARDRGKLDLVRTRFSTETQSNQGSLLHERDADRGQTRRIEREIFELAASVGDWPSPTDFKAAGKNALYVAASRAGGIEQWRQLYERRMKLDENPNESQ